MACCLQDGSGTCVDVDPLCCDELGGIPSPIGAQACLGDQDNSGVDDACEVELQACCLTDGSCNDLRPADCLAISGVAQGTGTTCAGPIRFAWRLMPASCESV